MAISEITTQRSTGEANSSTVTLTYSNTPAQDSLLVAAFWCRSRTVSSAPSGWNLANTSTSSAETVYMYYKIAGAGEGASHSWTMSGSGNYVIAGSEWTGINTASPLDVVAANNGSSTAGTTGTHGTLAQANELIVVAYFNPNTSTWSAHDNSQTEIAEITSTTGLATTRNTVSLASRIVSSTTGVNYGATCSASRAWGTILASFKEASASTNTGSFFSFF